MHISLGMVSFMSMKITGIVTEYNPFHKGHKYHIDEARRITQCDVLIAVMSGQFVQRGEPALIDKWQRTQTALEQGVDLVIELPYVACVQEASRFGETSIQLLSLAGCDHLVFGSESNDLEKLQVLADLPIQVDHLKEAMKTGIGYPKAMSSLQGPFAPNDILGIAYLKALKKYPMKVSTIQRTNSYHGLHMDLPFVSASALRKAALNHEDLHQQTPMESNIKDSYLNHWGAFYPYLRLKLITSPKADLAHIFLMNEGLENHLVKCALTHTNYDEFIQNAITKRYTKARIQRCLTHLLTHTTQQEVKQLPPMNTLRILGMNSVGRAYLKTLETENTKIASRFNHVHPAYRAMEYRATLAYASTLPTDQAKRLIQREIEGPIIIKD